MTYVNGDGAVRRLIQLDSALEAIESAVVDHIDENGQDEPLPEELTGRLSAFLTERAENIDRTAEFLDYIDSAVGFQKNQVALHRLLQAQAEAARDRVRESICKFLVDGEEQKLKGESRWIRAQRNGKASLVIENEDAVPNEYRQKTVCVTVPAEYADDIEALIRQAADFEGVTIKTSEASIDRKTLREAVEGGAEVEGVSIEQGYHLRTNGARVPTVSD